MPCLRELISRDIFFTMTSNLKQVVIVVIDQLQDTVTPPSVIAMNVNRSFSLLSVSVSQVFSGLKSLPIFAGTVYSRSYLCA